MITRGEGRSSGESPHISFSKSSITATGLSKQEHGFCSPNKLRGGPSYPVNDVKSCCKRVVTGFSWPTYRLDPEHRDQTLFVLRFDPGNDLDVGLDQ